jgi:hypothetical protein
MKLYNYEHLRRINLHTYASQNLEKIPYDTNSSKADSYYKPTPNFEKMVEQANLFAILKEIKPVKPVYKKTYISPRDNKMYWS